MEWVIFVIIIAVIASRAVWSKRPSREQGSTSTVAQRADQRFAQIRSRAQGQPAPGQPAPGQHAQGQPAPQPQEWAFGAMAGAQQPQNPEPSAALYPAAGADPPPGDAAYGASMPPGGREAPFSLPNSWQGPAPGEQRQPAAGSDPSADIAGPPAAGSTAPPPSPTPATEPQTQPRPQPQPRPSTEPNDRTTTGSGESDAESARARTAPQAPTDSGSAAFASSDSSSSLFTPAEEPSCLVSSLSSSLADPPPPAVTKPALASIEAITLPRNVERAVREYLADNHEVAAVRYVCDTLDAGLMEAQKTVRQIAERTSA
ncbi:MAG: hypothetical protein ACRDQA_11625 [Nocardioidaceae bacterium]